MNTKRWITNALAIALVPLGLAIAQPAENEGPGGPGGPGPRCPMDRPCPPEGPGRGAGIVNMFDMVTKALPAKLELTTEQNEKFKALADKNRAELQEIVKKLEAQRAQFDADLNAILTPEQQAKFKELKDRKEKMMKGHRPGGKRGMGMDRKAGGPGVMLKAIDELNLPEDRAAKANEIIKSNKESLQKAPRGDRQARMEIMKNTMTQLKEVLTPEEMDTLKEKMRQIRPAGPRGEKGMKGPGGRQHRGMKGPGKGMGPKNCPCDTCPVPQE